MIKNIDPIEKKILFTSILVAVGHLLLIAYAAIYLHIGVPTCQPNLKLFKTSELRTINPKHYEVHYIAKMWIFEPKQLTIPVGSTIDFFLTSLDVNHGFHIQGTNINLMAVPGVVNFATHTFNVAGSYPIVCHEFCGYGHHGMAVELIVSDSVQEAKFGSAATAVATMSENAKIGETLFHEKGCVACHSIDGTDGVGPTFKEVWGRTEELEGGGSVVVDEAYIIESIKNPPIKIVKGHQPVMPMLGLSDEEIARVIDYIKYLSPQNAPATSSLPPKAALGQALFSEKGCNACHSIDGVDGVGPTFKNLWGRTEQLEDGGSIVVDKAYVIESIKNPTAKVVKGHQPVMPVLGLSDEEIDNMVEYIKYLSGVGSESGIAPASPPPKVDSADTAFSIRNGKALFTNKGCVACHNIDDTGSNGVGPGLKGILGKQEFFEDGSSVIIDETYLSSAIKNPSLRTVKGYAPIMPQIPLSNQEVDQLIAYIKSL